MLGFYCSDVSPRVVVRRAFRWCGGSSPSPTILCHPFIYTHWHSTQLSVLFTLLLQELPCPETIMVLLHLTCMLRTVHQRSARSIFQLSRRERESLVFNLAHRDENENFCHIISCFETRPRIISFNLKHRDEIEIYFFQSQTTRRDREFF